MENRNEQFENIANIREEYNLTCDPQISIDSKKKEQLGEYSRPNDALYGIEVQATLDHDFKKKDTIMGTPHGIYDMQENTGYITLNTSSDTSEFVCDNIKNWWFAFGILLYPLASRLLILCDGGGSNSSRHYIFKKDLEKLATIIGIDIRIAHYPPYCSKWNPIEHRLFPHVSKAMRGANFTNIEMMSDSIQRTKTKTGLKVTVNTTNKVYETGRKVDKEYKNNMGIEFDSYLPKWNYMARR